MEGDIARGRLAKQFIAVRALRTAMFPTVVLADQAWAIMMEVFVRLIDNESIDADELLRRCETTPSVGRRWLAYLSEQGLLEVDAAGGEVVMTAHAADALRSFLDHCGSYVAEAG